MEEIPVKSEFGEKLEPKPIVIIPDSFRSEHIVDISTSKREEDLKSTNCPWESHFSNDSELPTVNLKDDLNRWTVSSSVILPLEETENTCHGSERSVDTGDTCRSVDIVILTDSVKNEDTYTCGTQICELNEHTGQLAVIPNLTMNPSELKTDSDMLLSPFRLDDNLDHNNSCRDSEIKTSNVSTSNKDDKRLIHSVDHPSCEDQVITPSISSQTSPKETSEQSNDTLESQTLTDDLSSSEQFDHSFTGNPEVNTFSEPTSIRDGTGEKPFRCHKCDVCNKEFTRSDFLSDHLRIHTGEKPYTCDICNRAFSHSSNLRRHKLTHTREKPHKCDVWCKTFTRPRHLREHQRMHTGKKPYTLNVCSNTFTQTCTFSKHQGIHTGKKPYKCDVCNKEFTRSDILSAHHRIHTGEKPYTCDICNRTFTQLGHLRSHKLTHKREKPHKCDVSNKTFIRPSNCKEH